MHSAGESRQRAAVIIPSWNTREYLDDCIASLRGETEIDLELLVVDNGSADGSLEYLMQAGISHIGLPENVGFAKAVNLGASRTHAPVVLVLNADVVLEPGCLRRLVAALARDPVLGGVQPKITLRDDGDAAAKVYSAGQGLTTAASAYEIGRGEPDGPTFERSREVFGVCGAVCLLRRELFADVGGYDERYFAFYEDVDLNARARLAGWRFAYVSDATATHVGHGAWGKQDRARAFNVRLTVQNRLSTAIKVLPLRCLPWVMLATARTVLASPFRRVAWAAIAGTFGILPRLPDLLRERRRLRSNGGAGLDTWITRRRLDRLGARG